MGTVMGFLNMTAISGAVIAHVVSGWIRDVSGSLEWAFYVGALVYLVALIFVGVAQERVRRN